MNRALVVVVMSLVAFACSREVVVLDSLSDDYCPADSSPPGTLGCEAGICPATPSCAFDYE